MTRCERSPETSEARTTLRARSLRSEATIAENRLGQLLPNRQVDGAQHAEQESYDAARSAQLTAGGHRILRFWNEDVLKNLEGVVEAIRAELRRPK